MFNQLYFGFRCLLNKDCWMFVYLKTFRAGGGRLPRYRQFDESFGFQLQLDPGKFSIHLLQITKGGGWEFMRF